jgi:hypothetical protein
MITKYKLFENNSVEDEIKIELYSSFGLNEFDIEEYFNDFYDDIQQLIKLNEYDVYDIAKDIIEYRYAIKFQDMHTAIYNLIEFEYKSEAIETLKFIRRYNLDINDDLEDIYNFIELNVFKIEDTYEINYRYINNDRYEKVLILDDSDIDIFDKRYKDYQKKQKQKKFNL